MQIGDVPHRHRAEYWSYLEDVCQSVAHMTTHTRELACDRYNRPIEARWCNVCGEKILHTYVVKPGACHVWHLGCFAGKKSV